MKRVLVGGLLCLGLFGSAIGGDWNYVASSPDGSMDTYVTNPKKFGSNYRAWSKAVFNTPIYSSVDRKYVNQISSFVEYDCINMCERVITSTFYYTDGTLQTDDDLEYEWKYHAPDTIGYKVIKKVCRR